MTRPTSIDRQLEHGPRQVHHLRLAGCHRVERGNAYQVEAAHDALDAIIGKALCHGLDHVGGAAVGATGEDYQSIRVAQRQHEFVAERIVKLSARLLEIEVAVPPA